MIRRFSNRVRFINGFTLIELLVVIAIISLLVSILLPSLQKAKIIARRTVCSSTMREIGMALQFYAEDNRGAYPPFYVKWELPVLEKWEDFRGCGFMQILMAHRCGIAYLPYSSDGNIPLGLRCPTESGPPRWSSSYALNSWRFNLVWTDYFVREVWLTTEVIGTASDRVMGYCHSNTTRPEDVRSGRRPRIPTIIGIPVTRTLTMEVIRFFGSTFTAALYWKKRI